MHDIFLSITLDGLHLIADTDNFIFSCLKKKLISSVVENVYSYNSQIDN